MRKRYAIGLACNVHSGNWVKLPNSGKLAQSRVSATRASMAGWIPLPDTADELCAVGRRLGVPDSEILLGANATETKVKELSEQGSRLRHFALRYPRRADRPSVAHLNPC